MGPITSAVTTPDSCRVSTKRSSQPEDGEALAEREDQTLDHQHNRRCDQHLPSPDNVSEPARRQLEQRGHQAVDREHDPDARETQAARLK